MTETFTLADFRRSVVYLKDHCFVQEAENFINKYKSLLPKLPEEGREVKLSEWLIALQYAAEKNLNPEPKTEKFMDNYFSAVRFQDEFHSKSKSLFGCLHLTQLGTINLINNSKKIIASKGIEIKQSLKRAVKRNARP